MTCAAACGKTAAALPFSPALANDPLVFVEIALTDAIPGDLAPLLVQQRKPATARSIRWCSIRSAIATRARGHLLRQFPDQERGGGVAKGNAGLKTFVTLSPVPGLRRWLATADLTGLVPEAWWRG